MPLGQPLTHTVLHIWMQDTLTYTREMLTQQIQKIFNEMEVYCTLVT